MKDSVEDDVLNDAVEHSAMLEEETHDVITDLLNRAETHVLVLQTNDKIKDTVELDGCCIYKSTLVLQLNDNNFLSKDRLARIMHTIAFNNHNNCV